MTLIHQIGLSNPLQFVILTLLIGGGLALICGYGLSVNHRSRWLAVGCGLLISAAIAYVRGTWLQSPMIILDPVLAAAGDIAANPANALNAIFWFLRGWLLIFALMTCIALLGYGFKNRQKIGHPA